MPYDSPKAKIILHVNGKHIYRFGTSLIGYLYQQLDEDVDYDYNIKQRDTSNFNSIHQIQTQRTIHIAPITKHKALSTLQHT